MPHYNEYRCSVCGNIVSRDLLVVKRVSFSEMRSNKKILRSRTVAWLCRSCLGLDPVWNKVGAYSGPGHTSPALERARADGLESNE